MKLLKSLTCVMLTSAAILSASGFETKDDVVVEERLSSSATQSHATAIGTDVFQMSPKEVTTIVLTTMADKVEDGDMKSQLNSLLGRDEASIVSALLGIDFGDVAVLTAAKDALVVLLESSTQSNSSDTPATWYTSALSMVPTSEATESATVWSINSTQKQVFELARTINEITYLFSADMESSMVGRSIHAHSLFSYALPEVLDILTNGRVEHKEFTAETAAEIIATAERAKERLIETLTALSKAKSAEVVESGYDALEDSEEDDSVGTDVVRRDRLNSSEVPSGNVNDLLNPLDGLNLGGGDKNITAERSAEEV